jgi:hypothetical protein
MFRNAIPVRVGVDLSIVFLWERREREGLFSRENDTQSLSDTHVHTFWRFQSWNCKGVIWQGAAAVAGVCSLRFSSSEPSTLSNPAVGGGGGAAASAAGAPMLPPSVFRLFVSESKHQQTKPVCVWQERLKTDLNQTPEIFPTLEFQPKVSWSRTLQIRVRPWVSLSLSVYIYVCVCVCVCVCVYCDVLHGNEIVVAVIRVVRVVWWWGNVTSIRRNFAMFIFAACPPSRALLWFSGISNFNSCFAVSWLR